ncbi:MAG: HEAT repeat domain-containing protein [Planctomycetota bacterium]
MTRRIALFGIVLFAALLMTMGSALADRLGGAYRGPYEDRPTPDNEEDVAVDSGTPETGQSGDTGTGKGKGKDADEPPEEPPPGDDDDDDDDNDDPETPPEGERNRDPGNPGAGPGQGPTNPGPTSTDPAGGGPVAVEDVGAYWVFWFEHNKEWILRRVLERWGSRASPPQGSSVYWFRKLTGQKVRSPVTEKQRKELVLPLLVESLAHKGSFVRDAAVLALGKLGTPEVVPHIAGRLDDAQDDIKEDALLALGLTGQEAAAEPLRRTLKAPDPSLKAFAALGLALLERKDDETLKLLISEYETATRKDDKSSQDVAACVALALGRLGDESVLDVLTAPMKRKGFETLKVYICQALGRIGGEKSLSRLVNLGMKDKDRDVRAAAVMALAAFPDKRVFKVLTGVKGGHRMTRLYSLLALGEIGHELRREDLLRKGIVNELRRFTEKPRKDKYAAMYGAMALGLMADDSSGKFFAEHLSKEERKGFRSEVHSAMAMALGLTDDRRAIRDLRDIALRGQLEPDYRGYAAFSLGVLGDTSIKEELKSEIRDHDRHELLRSGCWAVGLLGDRTDVPWLIECLKLDDERMHQVRGAAALAIGLIGDEAAVAPLVKMAREDQDTGNRAFAIAALGCLIDKEPLPRIARLFENVHYRLHTPTAREALENL